MNAEKADIEAEYERVQRQKEALSDAEGHLQNAFHALTEAPDTEVIESEIGETQETLDFVRSKRREAAQSAESLLQEL